MKDIKNCSFYWLDPFVIGLIDSLYTLATTSICVSLPINDIRSSVPVHHILNLPSSILISSRFATSKALLALSHIVEPILIMATSQVGASHSSINWQSIRARTNLILQVFLQRKVSLTFGSCWPEFVSHLKMVRTLISFEFVCFLGRCSELAQIMIAVWRLIVTNDRSRTGPMS